MDSILQNDFHLNSLFDKIKYIFDQSIWEFNGHFDHWFTNTKAFLCSMHMEFAQRETLSFIGSLDLFCTAPSINAWPMAEMLWQCIHEIFIYSCKQIVK